MRGFCFFVLLLLAGLSYSRAGVLTTLQDQPTTNLTESAKYSKMINFAFDGKLKPFPTTNLADEFRARHGIAVKTNAPTVAIIQLQSKTPPQAQPEPKLNPQDLFLWQHRDSDLSQLIPSEGFHTLDFSGHEQYTICFIYLKSATFTLSSDSEIITNSSDMTIDFDLSEESMITNLFNKFLSWNDNAMTNHAKSFKKEIARFTPNQLAIDFDKAPYSGETVCTFVWSNGNAHLSVLNSPTGVGEFTKDHILHFQSLLNQSPSVEEKLAAAIRNQTAENTLFK